MQRAALDCNSQQEEALLNQCRPFIACLRMIIYLQTNSDSVRAAISRADEISRTAWSSAKITGGDIHAAT